jgi:hypothetical protein
MGMELTLNTLGTLDRVDHGGEIYQKAISQCLDNVAVMVSYGLLNDLIMDCEHAQHAGFISPHLAAKAHDVGEHDGG